MGEKDIDVLKEQISRLMAALEDVNFECQRLERGKQGTESEHCRSAGA